MELDEVHHELLQQHGACLVVRPHQRRHARRPCAPRCLARRAAAAHLRRQPKPEVATVTALGLGLGLNVAIATTALAAAHAVAGLHRGAQRSEVGKLLAQWRRDGGVQRCGQLGASTTQRGAPPECAFKQSGREAAAVETAEAVAVAVV